MTWPNFSEVRKQKRHAPESGRIPSEIWQIDYKNRRNYLKPLSSGWLPCHLLHVLFTSASRFWKYLLPVIFQLTSTYYILTFFLRRQIWSKKKKKKVEKFSILFYDWINILEEPNSATGIRTWAIWQSCYKISYWYNKKVEGMTSFCVLTVEGQRIYI